MGRVGRAALCIGINAYPGTASELRGCVNDAEDWAAELKARGFETLLLLDGDAQKAAMISAIREMVASIGVDELLVVTFSGHGTWMVDEADGRIEALAPYDVKQAGPLRLDVLQELFRTRKAGGRIAFVSDSCHSGTIARKLAPPIALEAPRVRFLPPEHFLEVRQLAIAKLATRFPQSDPSRSDVVSLSAGQSGEYAFELELKGRANGVFTHCALEALKALPANATYQDWYQAVRAYLPSLSHLQRPRLDGPREQVGRSVFD